MPPQPPKSYFMETNGSRRSTRRSCRLLQRHGYETACLPHQPTVIIVIDRVRRPWRHNRAVLARLANSPRASIVVMSAQTGNVFQLDQRGNQPGRWIKRHSVGA